MIEERLVNFCQLDTATVIWEEGILIEKIPLSDWSCAHWGGTTP